MSALIQSKSLYLAFAETVDSLVAMNFALQGLMNFAAKEYPIAIYAADCRTVRCDIGRRSGKSAYIKSRASENDLIVVATFYMRQYFSETKAKIIVPRMLDMISDDRRFKTVYVDEPRLVFTQITENDFYRCLAPYCENFVFLGRS